MSLYLLVGRFKSDLVWCLFRLLSLTMNRTHMHERRSFYRPYLSSNCLALFLYAVPVFMSWLFLFLFHCFLNCSDIIDDNDMNRRKWCKICVNIGCGNKNDNTSNILGHIHLVLWTKLINLQYFVCPERKTVESALSACTIYSLFFILFLLISIFSLSSYIVECAVLAVALILLRMFATPHFDTNVTTFCTSDMHRKSVCSMISFCVIQFLRNAQTFITYYNELIYTKNIHLIATNNAN